MALTINNFTGFETEGNEEGEGIAGTLSYDTVNMRSGASALVLESGGTEAYELPWVAGGTSDAGGSYVVGFGFRFSANPTVNNIVVRVRDNGDNTVASVQLLSDETLRLRNAADATLATSGTLTADTWYYVEIFADLNSASGDWELFIDDTSVASGTGADFTDGGTFGGAASHLRFINTNTTDTVSYLIDDVYILSGVTSTVQRLGTAAKVRTYQGGKTGKTPDFDRLGAAGGIGMTQGGWDLLGDTPLDASGARDSLWQNNAVENGAIAFDDANANGRGPGPRNDLGAAEFIRAVKYHWHARFVDLGSDSTYEGIYGKASDSASTATVGQQSLSLTTTYADYFTLIDGAAAAAPAADQWAVMGFGKSAGNDDLQAADMWAHVLATPAVGAGSTGSADGAGAASATGAATHAAEGSVAGTGTATASGLGASTQQGAGSAAGSATVAGTSADIFYVDATGGNDTNTGTQALPWKTLAKVDAQTFSAGDQILFKRGEVFRNAGVEAALAPPSSGTSDDRITFGAYGTGAKPKILGSVDGTVSANWTNASGNIWRSPALFHSAASASNFATPAYSSATPTGWAANGGIKNTSIELGSDRDNDSSTANDNWVLDSGNVWRYEDPWVQVDGWTPDILILDGSIGVTGDKKGTTGGITALGHWGLIGGKFYIYSTSDPDTNYASIVFAELTNDGNCAVYHDNTDRFVALVETGGNPATQYAYLEVLDNRYAIDSRAIDHIQLDNLEVRHAARGIIVDSTADSWVITNSDVYQCALDGIVARGTVGGGLTLTTYGGFANGTKWQKFAGGLGENGHGVLFEGGATHTLTDITTNYSGEDGLQSGPGFTGTVNVTGWNADDNGEDCLDQKGGTFVIDLDGGVLNCSGRGFRQVVLHQQSAGNLTLKNGTCKTDVTTTGDMVNLARGGQTVTFERIFFDKAAVTNRQIIQMTGASDLVLTACAFRQQGTNSAVRIDATVDVTSKHNTFYAATANNPLVQLQNGNVTWTGQNDVYAAEDEPLIVWETGAAPSGTNFDNCLFHRFDVATNYLDNNGTTHDETDIDGGLTQGNLVVDAGAKTEDPDFVNKATGDLSIAASAGAATGGATGSGVTTDIEGTAYDTTDPEIGAYAVT